MSSTPHLKVAGLDDPALFWAFTSLHAALERPTTTLERQSRLATCIRLLLERCAEKPPAAVLSRPSPRSLARAREYLHDSLSENISLSDLAGVSGLSRFQLVRAFAAEFGQPPHAYQIQVRLARARALRRRHGARCSRCRTGFRRPEPLHSSIQASCRRHAGTVPPKNESGHPRAANSRRRLVVQLTAASRCKNVLDQVPLSAFQCPKFRRGVWRWPPSDSLVAP